MPAVRAELCTSQQVNTTLHDMLMTIRMIKKGGNSGKLKASAQPLPRHEPWDAILAKASSPLKDIVRRKAEARNDNILSMGARADGKDLKPFRFELSCPSCKASRDCASNKLFDTRASTVSCRVCHRSTSSTRWLCSCGFEWFLCKAHRDEGLRCGPQRPRVFI